MSNIKADSVDGFLILMKLLILEKKNYMNWTDSKAFTDWLWHTVYGVKFNYTAASSWSITRREKR